MDKRDPEGYRKLLAYKKACELQVATNELVAYLPKTKTFLDLADQMARSGRSGSKNIVEGWKRNTTQEYFEFLGFSIGAIEELKDDAADVATGVYENLRGVTGVMGEEWVKREDLDKLKFYPLPKGLDPAVELFLRAKEVNFLLYRLQQSLDVKMDKESTKPVSQRVRDNMNIEQKNNEEFSQYLASIGLKRLENGRFVGPDDLDYPH